MFAIVPCSKGDQDQGTVSAADTPSRERSPDRASRGGVGEANENKRMSVTTHAQSELPHKSREQGTVIYSKLFISHLSSC